MTHTNQTALDRDTIRTVLIRHGFTIKPGQTDLKPYVFEAAEALIELARRAQPSGGAAAPLSKAAIDAIVYECRQSGADTTYDIVNAAIAKASAAGAGSEHRGMYAAGSWADKPCESNAQSVAAPSSSASEPPAVVCKSCTSSDVVSKNSGNLNINDERTLFEATMRADIIADQGEFAMSRAYGKGQPYTFVMTTLAWKAWQARAAHQAATKDGND